MEPVAWHEPDSYGNVTTYKEWALAHGWKPLYTAPREWVGLTHIEIGNLWAESQEVYSFAKVIEAKLKEKNT
jgi:hypothetical protein